MLCTEYMYSHKSVPTDLSVKSYRFRHREISACVYMHVDTYTRMYAHM